ncbi:hypothetical protein K1T71_012069 [Dendrolimus kikuchii]|uniref:Uncharacterized protein n=1 Tax=Dendrolimus kikuchii TaxID=765133 RepID=A0ACC1CKH9_9NEOP|nr:hypothetical protein K1T71_012069 [Dendrolimus kikuchii]
MKIALLVLFEIYKIISIDARLIEKNTDSTRAVNNTDETKPTRITRDIYDDDSFTELSKEENGINGEFFKALNRRPRYFFRSKFVAKTIQPNIARVARESSGETENPVKNNTSSNTDATVIKNKSVLVKKPIPKFNDIDYDDDFQMRINKAPIKTADSVEHEDEDFNVDDYDFDINHDEFIGRGKPLVPRKKLRDNKIEIQATRNEPDTKNKMPVKQTEKLIIPVLNLKKERAIGNIVKKSVDKTKIDDYYDDVLSTVTPKPITIDDDELNDDNEDMNSKEGGRGRTIRSPWNFNAYVDKFSDKTSMEVNKFLSILPLFPQAVSKDEDIKTY